MSVPLAWAPFDDEPPNKDIIEKKKSSNKNRTMKKHTNPNVASIISKIHSDTGAEDEVMADFVPPPMPKSAGEERIGTRIEGQPQTGDNLVENDNRENPVNSDSQGEGGVTATDGFTGDGALTPDSFSNLHSTQVADYYRKNVPYFTQMSEQPITNRNELMKKMDKILFLLEEQQDHKIGHATEELILYSFVGVFLIFIVDSFARAGKYVR